MDVFIRSCDAALLADDVEPVVQDDATASADILGDLTIDEANAILEDPNAGWISETPLETGSYGLIQDRVIARSSYRAPDGRTLNFNPSATLAYQAGLNLNTPDAAFIDPDEPPVMEPAQDLAEGAVTYANQFPSPWDVIPDDLSVSIGRVTYTADPSSTEVRSAEADKTE